MTLRIAALLAVGLGYASAASAQEDLAAGELPSNAYTVDQGEILLHPLFHPSSYGLTDNVELRSVLLGNILGPNISLKYAFVQTDDQAIAIEPHIATTWGEGVVTTGADVTWTQGLARDRVNLGAGANFVIEDEEATARLPIHVGYEFVPTDRSTIDLFVRSDVLSAIGGTVGFNLGAHYYLGWERFRLGVGANLLTGPEVAAATELIDDTFDTNLGDLAVLPVPYVSTWWRF